MGNIHLYTGSDSPPPRVGFSVTLEKLILNEDDEDRHGQIYG